MIDFNISVRKRKDDNDGITHVLPPYNVSCRSRRYVDTPELDRPLVYTMEFSERVDSLEEVESTIAYFVSEAIRKIYKKEEE